MMGTNTNKTKQNGEEFSIKMSKIYSMSSKRNNARLLSNVGYFFVSISGRPSLKQTNTKQANPVERSVNHLEAQ